MEPIWQAFDRLETLEHTARIAILARVLGGSQNLPNDAIEKLINLREKAGYLGEGGRCQACGYLHETQLRVLVASDQRRKLSDFQWFRQIALSREELVVLDSGRTIK